MYKLTCEEKFSSKPRRHSSFPIRVGPALKFLGYVIFLFKVCSNDSFPGLKKLMK